MIFSILPIPVILTFSWIYFFFKLKQWNPINFVEEWFSCNRFRSHLHIERSMKKLIENPQRETMLENFNEFDDFHGSLKVNYITILIIQFGGIFYS